MKYYYVNVTEDDIKESEKAKYPRHPLHIAAERELEAYSEVWITEISKKYLNMHHKHNIQPGKYRIGLEEREKIQMKIWPQKTP